MRRPSPRTEAQAQKRQDRFTELLANLLREMGATSTEGTWGSMYPLTITTSVGVFLLSPERHAAMGRATATLFGRFDDHKRAAAAGFDCNPYSGKMNIHGPTLCSLKDAAEWPSRIAAEMARKLRLNTQGAKR